MLVFSLLLCFRLLAQDIVWEKRIKLKKEDEIFCMTQDQDGNIYLGGRTARGGFQLFGDFFYRTFIIKLGPDGDSIYTRDLGDYGRVYSMTCDPNNILRINTGHYYLEAFGYPPILLRMTPDGFVFKRDTVFYQGSEPYPDHCIMGSDSSLLITGNKRTNNRNGMFLLRVKPDYTYDQMQIYQPNNKSTEGNNIEELPNGRIMISGPFSNRLGSVEVNKDGTGDSSWVWGPDTTSIVYKTSSFVGQNFEKGFLGHDIDGYYNYLRTYDSTRNYLETIKTIRDIPFANTHTNGTYVFHSYRGNQSGWLEKRNLDTSIAWRKDLNQSVLLPGVPIRITGVVYNEDESAVFSGYYPFIDTAYRSDPYLIKIANVGTPVTSLIKPKKGILANESLAPWPNPSSSTVYLKQHFNRAEIHLYNMAGKEMGQYHLQFAQPIDVSGFESGIYLYRAVVDGKAFSGKIIKR